MGEFRGYWPDRLRRCCVLCLLLLLRSNLVVRVAAGRQGFEVSREAEADGCLLCFRRRAPRCWKPQWVDAQNAIANRLTWSCAWRVGSCRCASIAGADGLTGQEEECGQIYLRRGGGAECRCTGGGSVEAS